MSAEWTDSSTGNENMRKEICCLEFVLESDSVVFCSREGWVREWCPRTGQLRREVLMENNKGLYRSTPSPDGRHIALPIPEPTVLLLDCATGKEVKRFDYYGGAPRVWDTDVMITAFSCDGELIASGSKGGTIRVWRWTLRLASNP